MTEEARKILLGCLALHTSLLQSTWSTVSFHDLSLCPAFSGNQVAQNVRAVCVEDDAADAALHANAAGQEGVLAACLAMLEMAGGGGRFDGNGQLLITVEHVQAFRLLSLLPDVSLPLSIHRIPGQCM